MKKNELNIQSMIHHFGLDHLEIYGSFKDSSLFERLDFDNSNHGKYGEYHVDKHKVPKFSYKITFQDKGYTMFAFYKGIERSIKQPVGTRDYIVVYSTAFKLLDYNMILCFLEENLVLQHCRRFDICMDLKIDIDNLLDNNFEDYKTGRDYRKSSHTETRYYGEMKNSKNKRQLIRVYNKILDTFEKGKVDLYQEYLTYNSITRVELEIRQELAKVKGYKEVFDNTMLFGIFQNYLGKYTKIFDELPGDKITLFRSKNLKLCPLEYQSIYYKTRRYNYFVGAAKTLFELGFCPVSVLLHEGMLQDKTRYILGINSIHDVILKEKQAKRNAIENRYTRQTVEEILDNAYKYGKI